MDGYAVRSRVTRVNYSCRSVVDQFGQFASLATAALPLCYAASIGYLGKSNSTMTD